MAGPCQQALDPESAMPDIPEHDGEVGGLSTTKINIIGLLAVYDTFTLVVASQTHAADRHAAVVWGTSPMPLMAYLMP